MESTLEGALELIHGDTVPPTVLIAGKGHETYQTVGTTQHVFSDVEHARQALVARGVANA